MNKRLRDWLESILFSAVIVLILYFIFWPFAITGDSMESSFFHNDRIAISRVSSMSRDISRGDFTVCRVIYNGKEENVMKRVIGIPGDEVIIKDGGVFLNGQALIEDYLDDAYTYGEISVMLGDDEYFVMGDNRAVSYDSRTVGAVPGKNLVGRVIMKWFPFHQVKLFF